jgi:hypothetical protein
VEIFIMREYIQVGLSSLLAFIITILLVIGAPPSEFVQEPNIWLKLEFLMFPLLFGGVALSLLALFLTLFTPRGAAVSCISATMTSMVGVIIANGIDAEATTAGLFDVMIVLSFPMICALDIIRIYYGRRNALSVLALK